MGEHIKYKIAIVLDEGKIKRVGDYTPEELYSAVDSYFDYYNIKKIKSENIAEGKLLAYGCCGDKFGEFALTVMSIYEEEWFQPYLLKYKYFTKSKFSDDKWRTENVLDILRNFEVKGI